MWASPGRLPSAMEEGEDEQEYRRAGGGAMASCWGRFGIEALWQRVRQLSLERRRRRHAYGGRSILGAGGLNYDPLSYAQNFDDGGCLEHEHEHEQREPDFTARFAPARNAVSPGRA